MLLEMSEVEPIYNEGYIYINSNLGPLTESISSSTEFKDIVSWNISQMIMKTVPISTRIVIMGHPVLSLVES